MPFSSILTFGPNDSTVSINVSLIDNGVLEDMELFHVLLSSTTTENTFIVFDSYNASVVIVDHDCKSEVLHKLSMYLQKINKYQSFISVIIVEFSLYELFVDETDGVVSLMVVKEGDSEVEVKVAVQLEEDSATGMY